MTVSLQNDLTKVMDAIGRALEGVYDPSLALPSSSQAGSDGQSAETTLLRPFAKVDGVAPQSPASEAVCSSSLKL